MIILVVSVIGMMATTFGQESFTMKPLVSSKRVWINYGDAMPLNQWFSNNGEREIAAHFYGNESLSVLEGILKANKKTIDHPDRMVRGLMSGEKVRAWMIETDEFVDKWVYVEVVNGAAVLCVHWMSPYWNK